MASISNLGVGSGLDLNSLLASITKAESAPLTAINQQQASYNAKLSAYGQLKSALMALQTAAAALADPTLFQGVTASSTAADVLTASAGSTAASGSYAVNVTQLAQAKSLAAVGQTLATAPIGGGTINFDFASGVSTSVTVDANSTLEGIRNKINAQKDVGVTASIVNDGGANPFRLVLVSSKTGEASSMDISVTGGTGTLTSLFNTVPANGAVMTETVAAKNAELTVNGLKISSETNTVAGAIQGVTMTVTKVEASTLTVEKDTKSVESAVTTFVDAYNNLQTIATKLTAFDAGSKPGAALTGDSTLRNIQVKIRSALNAVQTGGGLTMLSQIGVVSQIGFSFQKENAKKESTLQIDSAKLTEALSSNLSGVSTLFSGVGGSGGYGTQLVSLLTGFTASRGTLDAATNGMNKSLGELDKQYSTTSERIDATIARYKAQFTQLDMLMSGMNQTSSYLTQQFDAMNSSSK